MKVAIVGGTAGLGKGLAIRLGLAGAEVLIGSRQAEKAVQVSDEVLAIIGEATVRGGANEEVVSQAEVVIVTVPYPGQAATYKAIKGQMKAGTVIVDCTVPLASEVGGKSTRVLGVWEGSAAQQAKDILGKDFKVASGFHSVMAGRLQDPKRAVGDVLVCGEKDARAVGEKLVGLILSARFIDCGSLENARILESITALLIGINNRYDVDGAGVEITGLEDATSA